MVGRCYSSARRPTPFPPAAVTRPRALLIVLLVWAGIYLPALGTLEIKGEEGRRILPAVTMLETGDWLVPHVGGEVYLSKPPGINWLIAVAFRLSGGRSEGAARAPSVLAVLALGLGLAWRGGALLGPAGGLTAALLTLTSIGLMEKGRLAEIEGVYVACYGLALVDWLAAWRAGSSPWRRWLVPAVPLGLGLLMKGPLLLLFFYAVVVAVLWRAGRLRELAHPAAGVGLALAVAMFLAWALPFWGAVPAGKVSRAWSAQFTGRLRVEDGGFRWRNWVQNVPRGLFNFFPWALLLPLVWRSPRETTSVSSAVLESVPSANTADDTTESGRWPQAKIVPLGNTLLRGGRFATAACFFVVSLLPGGLPRYTLPLIVPAALLLALAGGSFRLGKWPLPHLARFGSAACVLVTVVYAALVVPRQARRGGSLRRVAERLNAATTGSGAAYVLAPGYQPFLFYLLPSPRYVPSVDDLPAPGLLPQYLLVKEEAFADAGARLTARGQPWQPALTVDEKNRGRYRLLRLPAPTRATPTPPPEKMSRGG